MHEVCLNGKNVVVGFNFDIDLSMWTHKVIAERNLFFIGIQMPDRQYHSFHGINKNGNVGTPLYVNGNENGAYRGGDGYMTIADLTEAFIPGKLSLDEALDLAQRKKIVYAKDVSMQAMLSDKNGRAFLIEPGIGYRLEKTKYSLSHMTPTGVSNSVTQICTSINKIIFIMYVFYV